MPRAPLRRVAAMLLALLAAADGASEMEWINVGGSDAPIAPEGADILILMDATGSMGKWINAAKTEVERVIVRAEEDFHIQLRTSFIAYRDVDDTSRFQAIDFRPDTELDQARPPS